MRDRTQNRTKRIFPVPKRVGRKPVQATLYVNLVCLSRRFQAGEGASVWTGVGTPAENPAVCTRSLHFHQPASAAPQEDRGGRRCGRVSSPTHAPTHVPPCFATRGGPHPTSLPAIRWRPGAWGPQPSRVHGQIKKDPVAPTGRSPQAPTACGRHPCNRSEEARMAGGDPSVPHGIGSDGVKIWRCATVAAWSRCAASATWSRRSWRAATWCGCVRRRRALRPLPPARGHRPNPQRAKRSITLPAPPPCRPVRVPSRRRVRLREVVLQ